MNLVITVIQVLCSLVLVAIVMLQSGKSAGLSGAIAGGADTFLSKNKAKSVDAKLAKMTKWVAILWILLTLSLSIVHCCLLYTSPGDPGQGVLQRAGGGAVPVQPFPQADEFLPAGQQKPGLLGSQGLVPAILVIDGLLQLCPGGGGAQVDDLELHGATAAKLVDLGIKGRVHPAAGGQAQLPAVGGKPDGVQ